MRQGLTDITLVLDRSGSMDTIRAETEQGVRKFVEEQKKGPGEAVLSLWLFDEQHERPFTAVDIHEAPEFRLEPRGSTALLDAIGGAIKATGKRLRMMAEQDRPSQVIMVIITDGYENASRSYSMASINDMIRHQKDTYKWQFVFLGANQDAIASARAIGIAGAQAINYAASPAGTAGVYGALGQQIRASRVTGQSVSWSSTDRRKSMGQTDVEDALDQQSKKEDLTSK